MASVNILKEYNMTKGDINFTDEAIMTIIETHTHKEEGVRNMKRCIDNIVSKLNVLRYITAPVPAEDNDVPIDIKKLVNFKVKDFKLPYTVTNNNLSYFLKAEPENLSYLNMYI